MKPTASSARASRGGGGVEHLKIFHTGVFAGGIKYYFVSGVQHAGIHSAGDDAAAVAAGGKFVYALDAHPEGQLMRRLDIFKTVQHLQHGHALVPGHFGGRGGNIVTHPGGNRDKRFGYNADFLQECSIFLTDRFIFILIIADQIHLIHQHSDLPDAQHGQIVAVAAGVFLHAVGGVNHHQGRFGAGSAGNHVFQELDVARRVNDNIAALFRFEKAAAGVDGNALGLLVFQRVQQKSVFKRFWSCVCSFPEWRPACLWAGNLYPPANAQ